MSSLLALVLSACSHTPAVTGTSPSTTARPSARASTTKHPVATSTGHVSSNARTLPPPAAGTYMYDGRVESPSGTRDDTLTVTASKPSAVAGGMQQREDYNVSGSMYAEVIEWLSGRVIVTQRISHDSSGKSSTCTYNPPAVDIETPVKIGASWRSNHTCEGQPDIAVRVDRRETVKAGGMSVDTYVIVEHAVVRSNNGPVDVTQSDWFSTGYRIPIKLTQQQRTQDGTTYTSVFLVRSVTPA